MVHKFGLIHIAMHRSLRLIVMYFVLTVLCYEQTFTSPHRDRK
jgi:hypothetical protein